MMSSFLASPWVARVTAFCSLILACSGTDEPTLAGHAGSGGTTNVSSGGAFAGSAGSGGTMNGSGGSATADDPVVPVAPDCSGIVEAGFELRESTQEHCGAVFIDGGGCSALCAAAGLICETGLENVDGICAADDTLPALACDTGHQCLVQKSRR